MVRLSSFGWLKLSSSGGWLIHYAVMRKREESDELQTIVSEGAELNCTHEQLQSYLDLSCRSSQFWVSFHFDLVTTHHVSNKIYHNLERKMQKWWNCRHWISSTDATRGIWGWVRGCWATRCQWSPYCQVQDFTQYKERVDGASCLAFIHLLKSDTKNQ